MKDQTQIEEMIIQLKTTLEKPENSKDFIAKFMISGALIGLSWVINDSVKLNLLNEEVKKDGSNT